MFCNSEKGSESVITKRTSQKVPECQGIIIMPFGTRESHEHAPGTISPFLFGLKGLDKNGPEVRQIRGKTRPEILQALVRTS